MQRPTLNASLVELRIRLQHLSDVTGFSISGVELVDEPTYGALRTFVQIDPAANAKLTRDATADQAKSWHCRSALRDLIELTSIYLERCHEWMLVAQGLSIDGGHRAPSNEGDPEALEQHQKSVAAFSGMPLPAKLDEIRRLGVASELREHLLSINRVRNCVVHRQGRVSDRDAPDGALRLRFHEVHLFIREPGGTERVIRDRDTVVEPGSHLRGVEVTDRERSFTLGEQIRLSLREIHWMLFTAWRFAGDLRGEIQARFPQATRVLEGGPATS